jgi:hypothetical protein
MYASGLFFIREFTTLLNMANSKLFIYYFFAIEKEGGIENPYGSEEIFISRRT